MKRIVLSLIMFLAFIPLSFAHDSGLRLTCQGSFQQRPSLPLEQGGIFSVMLDLDESFKLSEFSGVFEKEKNKDEVFNSLGSAQRVLLEYVDGSISKIELGYSGNNIDWNHRTNREKHFVIDQSYFLKLSRTKGEAFFTGNLSFGAKLIENPYCKDKHDYPVHQILPRREENLVCSVGD